MNPRSLRWMISRGSKRFERSLRHRLASAPADLVGAGQRLDEVDQRGSRNGTRISTDSAIDILSPTSRRSSGSHSRRSTYIIWSSESRAGDSSEALDGARPHWCAGGVRRVLLRHRGSVQLALLRFGEHRIDVHEAIEHIGLAQRAQPALEPGPSCTRARRPPASSDSGARDGPRQSKREAGQPLADVAPIAAQ